MRTMPNAARSRSARPSSLSSGRAAGSRHAPSMYRSRAGGEQPRAGHSARPARPTYGTRTPRGDRVDRTSPARAPLVPRPLSPTRSGARQQAIRTAQRLGGGYRAVHHYNPRLRHPHYHVVRRDRRRWPGHYYVLRGYYPYHAGAPPLDDWPLEPASDTRTSSSSNRLLPHLSRINRRGSRYRAWLRRAIDIAEARIAPSRVRGIARQLMRMEEGWERAERALMRLARLGPPPGTRDIPTPGYYYQIKPGDRLSDIARAIYPNLPPLTGVQRINDHPFNRRVWRRPRRAEQRWVRDGIISFRPQFREWYEQGFTLRTEPPDGAAYALIFLPRLDL